MNESSEVRWRGAGLLLAILALPFAACEGGEGPSDVGSGGQPSVGGGQGDGGGFASGGQGVGGAASGGGASSGGAAAGGAASGGSGPGGSGGQSNACIESTEAKLPTVARSATFSGTDSEYSELYQQPCAVKDDCVPPCTERGGTAEFCAAHVCIDSEPDYCLPPTKWRSVTNALAEEGTQNDSAESSLDGSTVGFQDRLILEGFGIELPEGATVVGITAQVVRAYSSTDPVVDYSVRLVLDGQEVGSDLKRPDAWPEETLEEADYGGPAELWGRTWSREEVMSPGFGIAIGALPISGGRAYVDVVRMIVHYDACE